MAEGDWLCAVSITSCRLIVKQCCGCAACCDCCAALPSKTSIAKTATMYLFINIGFIFSNLAIKLSGIHHQIRCCAPYSCILLIKRRFLPGSCGVILLDKTSFIPNYYHRIAQLPCFWYKLYQHWIIFI